MAQLPGQVIAFDGQIGVVTAVSGVKLNQPDRVARDAATGAEVSRQSLPQLDAQQISVTLEDESEKTLTEHIDSWSVLGVVQDLPEIKPGITPPAGAFGELPAQQDAVDAVAARVADFAQEVRDAAVFVNTEAAVETVIESDGELTVAE